jgi:hypothetical protein
LTMRARLASAIRIHVVWYLFGMVPTVLIFQGNLPHSPRVLIDPDQCCRAGPV